MEKLFKALASEPRRRILTHLIEGPMTVGEIGNHFEMALPSISKHLAILKEAGVVIEQKRGQYILYSLGREELANRLFAFLAEFDTEAAGIVEARRSVRRSR